MNESLINRLRQTLNSQFYVMNDSWLRECVEYYISNHNRPTDKEIIEFVKAQWQLSDLRDINNETACLPKNLAQQKFTVLYGTYILQMDKMYDIATSKYKQLEQIRNISDANIEATEDNIPQSWEPRKKRMIQLHLTDGIQSVTAIEYSSISKLNDMLLPGYKIMIIGPVKCRRGIMLLEEINFKEVGGEVESLLIPNAVENILARALQLQENPDPYNDSEQPVRGNNQNNRPNDEDNFFDQDFEIDLEEVVQLEQRSQEIDKKCQNYNFNVTDSKQYQNNSNSSSRPNDPPVVKTKVDEDLNEILDLDDDFLEMIDENQLKDTHARSDIPVTTKDNSNTNLVTPPRTIPREYDSDSTDSDIVVVANTDKKKEPESYKPATFHISRTAEKHNAEFSKMNYKFGNLDAPSHSKTKTESLQNYTGSATERHAAKNLPDAYLASSLEISNSDANETKMTIQARKNTIASKAISPSLISGKRSASTVSPIHPGTSKVRCMQDTPKKNILNYMEKGNPTASPSKICDFICDIITETITEITFKTVRGRVTIIGKLSKNDSFWLLEGTITDGTASLDVSFASELLENLLGFSVREFSQKKKLKKTNPEVEQELRMALRNAELKLKDLDALLELEMTPSNKPKVVNIMNLTPEQKSIIEKRMKMLMI
ncbi:hypothetical protein KM043_008638 [Ampulex compressa]|nr:hypothetical protein KM043_008638 [Ampulex compressa]